jgi:signal transduction histidine kinase
MRRPIQIQLLLPTLSVVVLAIVLASAASAYLGAVRAKRVQQEHLRSVVETLRETKFPLSEPVLRQMSGLSGAEFIFLDGENRIRARTLAVDDEGRRRLDRLARGEEPTAPGVQPEIELGGRTYMVERVPVVGRPPVDTAGSLVVLYSEDLWSAAVRQAAWTALAAGALAVVAVLVLTTILAQRFVRPIRRLGEQAATIAQGDFTPMAVSRSDDEIRDLAVSIQRMTERLGQYDREVRRSEQLRTLGQLGAGIAHQLRNAATGGRMAIELHQRDCTAAAARESLDVALRQLRLMESYLQRFLTLSQPRPASRETVCLGPLLDDVAALVRPACLHAGIELSLTRPPEPLAVRGDAEELRQLAVNLVLNAVDAVGGHGPDPARIAVELSRLGDSRASLCVRDNGPGPAEAVAARLFEPFVTGKPDGSGLGLFVARQIAEDHGGTIRWQRVDGMTEFTVELPLTGS